MTPGGQRLGFLGAVNCMTIPVAQRMACIAWNRNRGYDMYGNARGGITGPGSGDADTGSGGIVTGPSDPAPSDPAPSDPAPSDPGGSVGTPACVIDYASATAAINAFNASLRAREIDCGAPLPSGANTGLPKNPGNCEVEGSWAPYELAVNEISQARGTCEQGSSRVEDPPEDVADESPVAGGGGGYAYYDPYTPEPTETVPTGPLPESKLVTTKAAIGTGVAILGVVGLIVFVKRKGWKKKRRRK